MTLHLPAVPRLAVSAAALAALTATTVLLATSASAAPAGHSASPGTRTVRAFTAQAPSPADLPAVDPAALRRAIAGLPDAEITSAQVQVGGAAGTWRGRSGVTELRHAQPVPVDGRFRIASATKMFTAAIVLQLVGEHRLALTDPVQRLLPDLLPRDYPPITVGQVLDHTSGLPTSTEDAGNTDPAWVVRHRLDYHSPRQVVASAVSQPMQFRPGTAQQYNGVNYFLAGLLIERVTGHRYATELRRRILTPLRLQDTFLPAPFDVGITGPHVHGYVTVHGRPVDVTAQSPYGWAESGLISTTADLNRFLRALLDGRLLGPAGRRALLTVPDLPYRGEAGGCAHGSGPARACFSMGLQRTELPGGLTVWGKSGGQPGFATLAVATADTRRVLSIGLSTTGNRNGAENDQFLRVAAAAFGLT